MGPIPSTLATGSLAEFVVLTANHRKKVLNLPGGRTGDSTYRSNTVCYQKIADALPYVKGFTYGKILNDLIDATYQLPAEEVIGQLSHATFPFDKMWIAGPSLFNSRRQIGALITADQESGSFTFNYVIECIDKADNMYNVNGARWEQYFQNGKLLDTRAIPVKVSMEGIELDEDALVAMVTTLDKDYKSYGLSHDATNLISEVYAVADYLARWFVVISSENIPSNFRAPKSDAEVALEAKNLRRKKMGKLPILPDSPVRIDLARINPKFFEVPSAKELHKLLGWTWVRRSKKIVSKYGVEFRRKPHERRIASPVDRRGAAREISSSDPNMTLHMVEGRVRRISNLHCPDA